MNNMNNRYGRNGYRPTLGPSGTTHGPEQNDMHKREPQSPHFYNSPDYDIADVFDSNDLDSYIDSHSDGYRPGIASASGRRSLSRIVSKDAKKEEGVHFNGISLILAFLTLAMCAAAGCLVSSGRLIEIGGVRKDQHSAAYDIQCSIDSIRLNTFNSINGMPRIYTLPLSNTPANKANPEGFSSYVDDKGVTHSTYTDDTISVDCWRSKYKVDNTKFMASVAKVKIAHPTQLRTGFAGGKFGSRRSGLRAIGKSYNAIIGINGEMYNHPGRKNILIRQGTVYRSSYTSSPALFIDSHGDFIIRSASKAISDGILEDESNKILQTFGFGPPLVVDGKLKKRPRDDTHFSYNNPRAAVGQLGELEYLLVVIEGRTDDSYGATVNVLAKFMYNMGCIQAYNLDGGHSAEMIFNNKIFSATCYKPGNERANADLLYFGTAMPEQ